MVLFVNGITLVDRPLGARL